VAGSRLPCRLLIHGPSAGAWNMAVDEALLETADAERIATLRLYEWAAPTLSLGYFQPAANRHQHSASLECPLVRRSSGGGAILHDRELTYSFAIPMERQTAADATRLSMSIHESLATALERLGISAQLCQKTGPHKAEQPFLCFARRAVGDLLAHDCKFAGSAQRRRRGAILQHGSVLLATSRFAPELPGLLELTGQAILAGSVGELFQAAVGDRFNVEWMAPAENGPLGRRAAALVAEKFGAAAWNLKR
jgi:lipoyl(octanoyl) transferase